MYEFKMPSLGAEMTRGKLLEWKIKVGDSVKRHDIIAVIDTDKTAIEIESFGEGVVEKLIVNPGDIIPVGTVMAMIRDTTGKAEAPMPQPVSIKISPRAKKLLQQSEIDISKIKGSGPDGAIIEDDIKRYMSNLPFKEENHAPSMKRVIAAAMTKSKREIPHYYLSIEIDFKNVLGWLEKYNKQRPITERMLYVAPLIKGVVNAIKKHPEFNGFFINNEHKKSDVINIGIAISLRDGGLIAPALLNAEKMTLVEIMHNLTDLVERARSGKLRSSEISDPTITITNLGELGVNSVFGIIHPPQVALIGIGKICQNNAITMTLSADHRVTNGHLGSRFLSTIDKFLKEPDKL